MCNGGHSTVEICPWLAPLCCLLRDILLDRGSSLVSCPFISPNGLGLYKMVLDWSKNQISLHNLTYWPMSKIFWFSSKSFKTAKGQTIGSLLFFMATIFKLQCPDLTKIILAKLLTSFTMVLTSIHSFMKHLMCTFTIVCSYLNVTTFAFGNFMIISGHSFANYMNIFHKT